MGAPAGNQNAVKQRRVVTDMLNRVVAQDPEKLRKACQAVLDKASEGDIGSFTVLGDRLDGKPKQAIEHGASDDPEDPTRNLIGTCLKLLNQIKPVK